LHDLVDLQVFWMRKTTIKIQQEYPNPPVGTVNEWKPVINNK
jgi:hypothetical protein